MGSSEKTGKKKRTGGRKKIAIEKLESNEKRQVTFSKRRTGLTNKASELCILCGVEIAIITSSPTRNRVFAFGHPNVDLVLDRFLLGSSTRTNQEENKEVVEELGRRYLRAIREVQSEREKIRAAAAAAADTGAVAGEEPFLWGIPIEGMEVGELQEYMNAMKEMRERLVALIQGLESMGGDAGFLENQLPPLPSHTQEELISVEEGDDDLDFLSDFFDTPPAQICGPGFI